MLAPAVYTDLARPYPPPAVQVQALPVTGQHSSTEKYLAYLPHSGFHNQRVSLENALFLAKVTNRTLLLPPVRLGVPLSYAPFDDLYQMSANSTKAGLSHCARTLSSGSDLQLECVNYTDFTYVPWDWLVDLSEVKRSQPLQEGWNFTDAWLQDMLGVSPEDVFSLKDTVRNQYSFQDFLTPDTSPLRNFNESIHISALARRSERLIQLGTLFGSSRLHLRAAPHFTLRRHIREQMAFTNPSLVRAATAIHNTLGRAYLAVHMRIGDGVFEWNAPENVRVAWWKLLRGPLRLSDNAIIKLERELFPDEDVLPPPPLPAPDLPALRSPLPPRPPFPTDAMVTSALSCRGPLHTAPHLLSLNAPLYIATDARAPSLDALLWRFVRAFPCVFFLEDFAAHTRPLGKLWNEEDGVALGGFLMPFLDAMVAGQGWEVVGTEQSTFSAFVVDVLWRKYHGYEIVQRG